MNKKYDSTEESHEKILSRFRAKNEKIINNASPEHGKSLRAAMVRNEKNLKKFHNDLIEDYPDEPKYEDELYDEKWLGDDTKHELRRWQAVGVGVLSILVQLGIGVVIVGAMFLVGANK